MSGYQKDLADTFVGVGDDRHLSVFPRVLTRIARRRDTRSLLDYGGGDGEFASVCTSLPLRRIVTYDLSAAMNDLAERRAAADSRIEVFRSTSVLPDGSFDVVTSNGVWMCWATEDDCARNLGEIARLLPAGGLFLAAVTHPCFRDRAFATFRTDFDPARYLDDGTPFRVTMFDGEREVELHDTHWSLGAMTRQLRASGLQLVDIVEVPDLSGALGCPWMIVEARKG
jgi:SAM-dependent methyltransferase